MNFSKLGQSLTAKEILDLVQDDLRKVEREIGLESMASGTIVSTISQHLNGNGGKRLRPILLLLSAKLVGETNPSCIHLGAVVEMIHTATLVHDDIIDVAETRRGQAIEQHHLGQSHECSCGRLAIYAGVSDRVA